MRVPSGYTGDAASYRYLLGLIYAAAAVIPAVAARRPIAQAAVVVGTCVFALSAVISMAQHSAAKRPREVRYAHQPPHQHDRDNQQ